MKLKTAIGEMLKLPAYRAVGLKWEGTYFELPSLKQVIHEMSTRVTELKGVKHQDIQLGLSYHWRHDGFVHYSVYEVEEDQVIPAGMTEIKVPAMSYLKVHHPKGKNIGDTYTEIYQWFKDSDYTPYRENDVDYYDELPIKHERYPRDRDINNPHFEIFIPLIEK
jgi:predicted transcriptional regulator YdeE